MNRAPTISTLRPALSSALAIVAAFAAGGAFLATRGKHPIAAYRLLVERGAGSSFGVTETLIKAAPLLLVSAGLLVALRAGVWNIGIDGQVLVGAFLTAIVAPELAGRLPLPVLLLLSATAGIVGGVAWASIPGLLKVRYGLNEIITTIMMNYVAIYLTTWLVKGPFKDPAIVAQQTTTLPTAARLPFLPSTRVHIGLIIGVVAVLTVAFLLHQTVIGFQLTTLGQSRKAAIHAGMPVTRLTLCALLLSGGCAGLAGANDVLGVKGVFQAGWNPGYGLTAFALVYLARLTSLAILPLTYLFALLLFGGELMSRSSKIPVYFVQMLEGLMLVFFAIAVYLERAFGPRASYRAGSAALEPPDPASRTPSEEAS